MNEEKQCRVFENDSDYRAWIDEFKLGGGEVEAFFLPTPAMVDWSDLLIINIAGGAVVSLGYTQALGVRVWVEDNSAFVTESV
jgi:hypothetical protein